MRDHGVLAARSAESAVGSLTRWGEDDAELSAAGVRLLGDVLRAVQTDEQVRALGQFLKSLAEKSPVYITPAQSAALLGVSRPTVTRWIAAGVLTDSMVNTHHKLDRDEVLQLREQRRNSTPAARPTPMPPPTPRSQLPATVTVHVEDDEDDDLPDLDDFGTEDVSKMAEEKAWAAARETRRHDPTYHDRVQAIRSVYDEARAREAMD